MLTYNLDGDERHEGREKRVKSRREGRSKRGTPRSVPWGSIDRSIDGSHPSVTRLSRSPRGSWSPCETDERKERRRQRRRKRVGWIDVETIRPDSTGTDRGKKRQRKKRERERERASPEGPLVAQLSHLPIGPSHVLICLLVNPASLLSFISFLPFVEPSAPPPSPHPPRSSFSVQRVTRWPSLSLPPRPSLVLEIAAPIASTRVCSRRRSTTAPFRAPDDSRTKSKRFDRTEICPVNRAKK